MAEGEGPVHPGSWLGDAAEEFKKMPPWGKALALGAIVLVAYLGYRAYAASKASSTTTGTSQTGSTLSGNDVASGQDTGGAQSPFALVPAGPTVSTVPVVPQGLQPVFDGVGNLIGWQQTPSPAQAAAASTPPASTPTSTPPVKTPLHKTEHLHLVQTETKPAKPTVQPHYKQTQPPQQPTIKPPVKGTGHVG